MRTVSITNLPNNENIYILKRVYNYKDKCVCIKKEYVGTFAEIIVHNETKANPI